MTMTEKEKFEIFIKNLAEKSRKRKAEIEEQRKALEERKFAKNTYECFCNHFDRLDEFEQLMKDQLLFQKVIREVDLKYFLIEIKEAKDEVSCDEFLFAVPESNTDEFRYIGLYDGRVEYDYIR